ncbi:MAG: DUF4919 domain-containing protein [Tidjanibacter sp.]|nr:DUF4919 domain-containing protein [Tidjanibacter sp.]
MRGIRGLFFGLMLAWVLVMGTVPVSAQTLRVPDNEDVLVRTIDIASPYYIDNLLGRYLSGDDPLTDEEYHYLYYGYAYSEQYRPLEPIVAESKVLAVVEEIMTEPTEERMNRLIDSALEVMERDPFSPKNLNLLAYAYGSLGDTVNERRCYERLEGVLRTIQSSGSGVKESSPMHILRFEHAADVIYARGLDVKKREVVSRTCEYIFLTMKDEKGNAGYYFDFSRIYWVKSQQPTRPEKRGWTINNVPVN